MRPLNGPIAPLSLVGTGLANEMPAENVPISPQSRERMEIATAALVAKLDQLEGRAAAGSAVESKAHRRKPSGRVGASIVHQAVWDEAVSILQIMIENVAEVRPIPGGSTLFALALTDDQLDRLAVWGASIEDYEMDADFEPDNRQLPARLPETPPAVDGINPGRQG